MGERAARAISKGDERERAHECFEVIRGVNSSSEQVRACVMCVVWCVSIPKYKIRKILSVHPKTARKSAIASRQHGFSPPPDYP